MKSELASPAAVRDLVNLRDFEAAARARLDPVYYDYFASGAQDEITVAANEAAFRRRALVPRILRGCGRRDWTRPYSDRTRRCPSLWRRPRSTAWPAPRPRSRRDARPQPPM